MAGGERRGWYSSHIGPQNVAPAESSLPRPAESRRLGDGLLRILAVILSFALLASPLPVISAESDGGDSAHPGDDATADDGVFDGLELAPVEVAILRPLSAASHRTVRDRDFLLLPRQTSSDLLLAVPHLHISQHSGGGKGHQIFLRGFDAEHGEDLAVYLEGVPVNLPSHIHGLGYADLHFLLPEAVSRMELMKGPFDVRRGDFSLAGSVDFTLRSRFVGHHTATTYGSFNTFSQRLHASPCPDTIACAVSAEYFHTDGFTRHGLWDGGRVLARLGGKLAGVRLHLLGGAYVSAWDAADTVPASLVESGEIGFYDGVDDSDGGRSQRYHLSAHLKKEGRLSRLTALLYGVRTAGTIFSNYTYFLNSPERGDQTEQGDDRYYFGGKVDYTRTFFDGGPEFLLRCGAEYRGDLTLVSQWRTNARERWDLMTDLDAQVHATGLYAAMEYMPIGWLRAIAGARYDQFMFRASGVEDLQRPSGYVDQEVPLDGEASMGLISPKATLVFSPLPRWDLFLNYGRGFHSPDVRDAVRNRDAVIPDAHVSEIASRVRWGPRLDLALSLWTAWVADELFFDPQIGQSVGQGESRRVGAEIEVRSAASKSLFFYADCGYTDARLIASGDPVVGSPRWMISAGAAWRSLQGLRGNLRLRHIGARPLDRGQYSEPAWVVDVLAGWDWKWLGLGLTVENLLGSQWKDSQFYYQSRTTPTGQPLHGRHFTPGTPFSVKGTLTLRM